MIDSETEFLTELSSLKEPVWRELVKITLACNYSNSGVWKLIRQSPKPAFGELNWCNCFGRTVLLEPLRQSCSGGR